MAVTLGNSRLFSSSLTAVLQRIFAIFALSSFFSLRRFVLVHDNSLAFWLHERGRVPNIKVVTQQNSAVVLPFSVADADTD